MLRVSLLLINQVSHSTSRSPKKTRKRMRETSQSRRKRSKLCLECLQSPTTLTQAMQRTLTRLIKVCQGRVPSFKCKTIKKASQKRSRLLIQKSLRSTPLFTQKRRTMASQRKLRFLIQRFPEPIPLSTLRMIKRIQPLLLRPRNEIINDKIYLS